MTQAANSYPRPIAGVGALLLVLTFWTVWTDAPAPLVPILAVASGGALALASAVPRLSGSRMSHAGAGAWSLGVAAASALALLPTVGAELAAYFFGRTVGHGILAAVGVALVTAGAGWTRRRSTAPHIRGRIAWLTWGVAVAAVALLALVPHFWTTRATGAWTGTIGGYAADLRLRESGGGRIEGIGGLASDGANVPVAITGARQGRRMHLEVRTLDATDVTATALGELSNAGALFRGSVYAGGDGAPGEVRLERQ